MQGDHGPDMLGFLDTPTEVLTELQIQDRYSVLNAMRLSDRCKSMLYQEMSLVNTFRIVIACIEGQEIPLVPDEAVIFNNVLAPREGIARVWKTN